MRVGYNPLPWALTDDGFDPSAVPSMTELGRELRAAGFLAIQADVPEGVTPAAFSEQLKAAGLAPAPGYFQARLEAAAELTDTLEHARRFAAGQAALGLSEAFLADVFNQTRVALPGRGVESSTERLKLIADHVAQLSEVMNEEGIRPCLHPHVGTWIETVEEAEIVLNAVDPDKLLIGPDNAHLIWAGGDPCAFVRRHRTRIGAAHIKDLHLDALKDSGNRGESFFKALNAHVVTEPGRGDARPEEFLAALGDDFDGWLVVEVDRFDLPTPRESLAAAGRWVHDHVPAEGGVRP